MKQKDYEVKLIKKIIESIENNGGKKYLSSIILTGSFGRGEPTYKYNKDGSFKLKSDVEIALVYKKEKYVREVKVLIDKVSKSFEEELNLMPISRHRVCNANNFNFTILNNKYKTLFTYDLFNGSYTVWGEELLKCQKVTLNQLDLYEGKRIVANRIGEMIYLTNLSEKRSSDYIKKQWKGKICLAIVTAWLLLEGQYSSSYHSQYHYVMNNKKNVERVLGKDFTIEYNRVFNFLRNNGNEYEIEDKKLREYIRNINECFKKRKISKPKVNNIARTLKYFIKYFKAGMKYGIINYEEKILQTLINEYVDESNIISETATLWHKVLY